MQAYSCVYRNTCLFVTRGFTAPRRAVHPDVSVFVYTHYGIVVVYKFKRAITDSDTENCVHFDPANKPGVSNLMNIYSAVTGKSFDEIEREFEGQGYGVFKPAVGDAVIETLRPIREEATRLLADKAYLCSVYTEGAQKASVIARKTLRKVYKKVGLVEKPF